MIRKLAQGYIAIKWLGFDLGFLADSKAVTVVGRVGEGVGRLPFERGVDQWSKDLEMLTLKKSH